MDDNGLDLENIATLIAIILFYAFPYLRNALKKRKERAAQKQAQKQTRKQARKEARKQARAESKARRQETTSARERAAEGEAERPVPIVDPGVAAKRVPEPKRLGGFTDKLIQHAEALLFDATALRARALNDERTVQLAPPLAHELIAPLKQMLTTVTHAPTMTTLVQEGERLRALETLFAYTKLIVDQRLLEQASYLGDADRIAEGCYRPILEFTQAHSVPLRTMRPVTVHGDWDMSIVLQLASSSIAPLRVPNDFGRSLWLWPAIAHEIAHDVYFGVTGLPERLLSRLGLPHRLSSPRNANEIDDHYLRELLGPWMDEIFADVFAVVMLGPAAVETMRRAFARPDAPLEANAVMATDGEIDRHPPPTFRVHVACTVLHFLGQHHAADDHWEAWTEAHPSEGLFFLPTGHAWVGFSQQAMFDQAAPVLRAVIEGPWPELAGYHLIDIPGLTYLHAEHADVEAAIPLLLAGKTVDAAPRLVIAAAVLAAADSPGSHDRVLSAARESILARGEDKPDVWEGALAAAPRDVMTGSFRDELRQALSTSAGLRRAIAVGAALNRPSTRR